MLYLDIWGLAFESIIVIFQIRIHRFVKFEFLTHTMNFYIGSTLSKGPGSAFSEGPGPSTIPLYKVCPNIQIILKHCVGSR